MYKQYPSLLAPVPICTFPMNEALKKTPENALKTSTLIGFKNQFKFLLRIIYGEFVQTLFKWSKSIVFPVFCGKIMTKISEILLVRVAIP